METTSKFTVGLDARLFGRWLRLIVGAIVPLVSIARQFITGPPLSLNFYMAVALYFIVILGVYLAAHYFLGEQLFAKVNPWVSTIILVGPPVVILIFQLGPGAFQLALALYIAISLIFNFIMSYGGCEVAAIPSFIFRRKYVVYCPWNVIDVVENAVVENMSKSKIESIVELLPEGLTEDTVEKIAKLVDDHLTEQLDVKMAGLNSRVMGFLNLHIRKN